MDRTRPPLRLSGLRSHLALACALSLPLALAACGQAEDAARGAASDAASSAASAASSAASSAAGGLKSAAGERVLQELCKQTTGSRAPGHGQLADTHRGRARP